MAVRENFLYKNQRLNRCPPNIIIKALRGGEDIISLWPVKHILSYIRRTKDKREGTALFCTQEQVQILKRPISLRICKTIEEACPGSIPRGHDVRKMAASLAWVRGVAPSEIMEAAFWKSSSTFITHYLNSEIFFHKLRCLRLRNSILTNSF